MGVYMIYETPFPVNKASIKSSVRMAREFSQRPLPSPLSEACFAARGRRNWCLQHGCGYLVWVLLWGTCLLSWFGSWWWWWWWWWGWWGWYNHATMFVSCVHPLGLPVHQIYFSLLDMFDHMNLALHLEIAPLWSYRCYGLQMDRTWF